MKTGLVTTTINTPHALQLIAQQDESLHLFIAADLKSPPEAEEWCYEHLQPKSRVCYLTPDQQKDLGYKSSEIIGWNTDSRRNIAILEAVRAGCELLVSWDDDMIVYRDFLYEIEKIFFDPYSGLQVGAPRRWANINALTHPESMARGIPISIDKGSYIDNPTPIVGAEIGVAQGVILGVPDASATWAIERGEITTGMSDILRNGLVVDPRAYTVFNSQLTIFRAELAPAFAQFYAAQQRNTDILASLLMRRLMRDRNLYTYYGPPAAFHARQPRPLLNDLKAEMIGLSHIQEWADYLDRAPVRGESILDDTLVLVAGFGNRELFPNNFWEAWISDCEKALT